MIFHDIPFHLQYLRRKYQIGPAGVGMWTVDKDDEGWYWSLFLKPIGAGARTGSANQFKYVERMTSKRRSRKACRTRSVNLSRGKPATAGIRGPAKRGLPGTGYCMKEKKTVFVDFIEEFEAKNGRTMIRGNCKDCGTKVQKYGRLVLCANCAKRREGATDDYLCLWCRTENP